MANPDEVKQRLLDAIAKELERRHTPHDILRYAEASAWVIRPDQPHGGTPSTASKPSS